MLSPSAGQPLDAFGTSAKQKAFAFQSVKLGPEGAQVDVRVGEAFVGQGKEWNGAICCWIVQDGRKKLHLLASGENDVCVMVDPVAVLLSTTPVDDAAEIDLEQLQKECLAAFNANAKPKPHEDTLGPKSSLRTPESGNDKKLNEVQQQVERIEEGAFVAFFWLLLLFSKKKQVCKN